MTGYEAIPIGETVAFGSYAFTAERIKAFARAWDPQRFHVDEAEAAKSNFGALCASGWHTCAAMMRVQVDYFAERAKSGAPTPRFGPSPGFENLRWLKPVYAGDTITFSGRVVEKRRSRSRPGMGLVTTEFEGVNQHGQVVMTVTARVFVAAD